MKLMYHTVEVKYSDELLQQFAVATANAAATKEELFEALRFGNREYLQMNNRVVNQSDNIIKEVIE
ncbi:MAG: hypothetical protein ACRC3Z_11225 [Phocaeicola sp.]